MSPADGTGGDGGAENGDGQPTDGEGDANLDGTYRATVDRIVEEQAVLLVEDEGEVVAERHLPVESLPEGAEEGTVCEVAFAEGDLLEVVVRQDETDERRRRLRERFDSLSRRLGDEGSDDREGRADDREGE